MTESTPPRPRAADVRDADGAGRRVALAVLLIAAAVGAGLILSRGRIGPVVPANRTVTMSSGARLQIPDGYEGRYLGFMNKERTVEGAYFCPVGTPHFDAPPPPGLEHGNIVNFTVETVDPSFPMSAMRDQLVRDYKNGVLKAPAEATVVNGWSGFRVRGEREFETVLLGPARIYTFVSTREDMASQALVASLSQVITPVEEARWTKAGLPLTGNIVRENRAPLKEPPRQE